MAMAMDFAYFQIFPDVFMLSQQKRTVICHHDESNTFAGVLPDQVVSPRCRFHRIARLWTSNEDQEAAMMAQSVVEA
jgi:hypothetical protein